MTSRYMSSNSLMDLLDPADARGEAVDVLGRVVEVEAGAVRGGDAELAHQRLAAVVARSDRDAVEVEELRDVVLVRALDGEAYATGALVRGKSVARTTS